MANITAKTSSNIFYKARCEAAKHNEPLSSREGAADIMSIDRGRLYRIESGIANPYPEEIHLMSDLYCAPELENFYCTNMCPLGCEMPKVGVEELDRITLRALSSLRNVGKVKDKLLDITADGIISEGEKPDMEMILEALEELEQISQSFRIWAKKNMQREEVDGYVCHDK